MISRIGEPKQDQYVSGTYDSITVNAQIVATTANTPIVGADYKPEQVQVKVVLKRKNGKTYMLMNDNLLVLGVHNSLKKGLHWFMSGFNKVYSASGVKGVTQRSVTLKLGGHHRVNPGDVMTVEVSPGLATFSSAIDTSVSYIEFYANPSVGYEAGVFTTRSQVVQESTTNQPFSLGDNITKVSFLNFNKDNLSENVIETLSLSSDRLDKQLTFQKLLAHIADSYPEAPDYRYGATPPTQSVFRFTDRLPQSFVLFDGSENSSELDEVRLDITFNGSNVAASQNYVVWTQYEATQQEIQKAINRQNKHLAEKVAKTPVA